MKAAHELFKFNYQLFSYHHILSFSILKTLMKILSFFGIIFVVNLFSSTQTSLVTPVPGAHVTSI